MARGQAIGNLVFNRPQLIALDALQPIVNYLSHPDRATGLSIQTEVEDIGQELLAKDFEKEEEYRRYRLNRMGVNPDTMVGTLEIEGVLTYRSGSMGADCTELTSYEGLKKKTEDMISEGVNTIVMKVDSAGGMAYGMFSAANYIKKITKQNGVKTVAYVDGVSYSAAYGLSVLADEIIMNPQASVGSIGVVVSLYNDSKQLEKEGISRQFVYAGDNKIPFDKSGEFTDKFLKDLQKSVDKTYNSFVAHVAKYRGLDNIAIRDTQASTYDADEALDLGLVDRVMELEDFEVEYGVKSTKFNSLGFDLIAANSDINNSHSIENSYLIKSEVNMSNSDKNKPQTDELLSDDTHVNKNKMDTPNMKEDLSVQLTAVQNENSELKNQLLEKSKLLKEYEGKVEELNALVEEKEMSMKISQRQARLEEALGKENDKVSDIIENTKSLSDEQFEVIATSLAGTQESLQKNLKEFGDEGQEAEVQISLAEQLKKTAESMNQRA